MFTLNRFAMKRRGDIPLTGRLQNRPLATESAEAAFWDFRMSTMEVCLLVGVVMGGVSLHLGPVLHSALGVVLLYALAACSYLSPVTAFVYFACAQFLPFPESSPNNPAQIGVLVWLPVALLRYRRINLGGLSRLWPVLPFLIWYEVLTDEHIYLPNSEYMKALFYSAIACHFINESKGQHLKCLFGLCLGAILVMIAYWALQLGLPVEINDWGADREGFARQGGGRADAVMVWPALLMGISGLIGIQIAFASKISPGSSPKWLTYVSLMLTIAALPPLISTMCHGAVAGLICILGALIWAGNLAAKGGAMRNPRFRQLVWMAVWGVVIVALLFAADAFQLRTKMFALDQHYKETMKESGAAASRSGVWHDSINTIMTYPLFGIKVTGDREVITSEYASQGNYLSHNIFPGFWAVGRNTGDAAVGVFLFLPGLPDVGCGGLFKIFAISFSAFCLVDLLDEPVFYILQNLLDILDAGGDDRVDTSNVAAPGDGGRQFAVDRPPRASLVPIMRGNDVEFSWKFTASSARCLVRCHE
jgi:hypothetical protein